MSRINEIKYIRETYGLSYNESKEVYEKDIEHLIKVAYTRGLSYALSIRLDDDKAKKIFNKIEEINK